MSKLDENGNRVYRVARGKTDPQGTLKPIRFGAKLGRNEPCHCGSGLKFKRCCLPKHEGM